MTPADLAAVIRAALISVLADRGADTSVVPESVTVERPRNPEHGDYATNIALQLAKKVGSAPRELAQDLATALVAVRGDELRQRLLPLSGLAGVRVVRVARVGVLVVQHRCS